MRDIRARPHFSSGESGKFLVAFVSKGVGEDENKYSE